MERVEVRITVPAWLMDEVVEVLCQDVRGGFADGDLDLAIEQVVEDFLEVIASGDQTCPQRLKLADAVRRVRARRRFREELGLCAVDVRKTMAATGGAVTALR